MRINLKEKCEKRTVTREDGELIYKLISDAWNKTEKVTVDFSNILIASVSFLDESFGKLAFEHNLEELKQKLSFENMEKYDRALLNDILISRYHQKEKGHNGLSRKKKRNIDRRAST